jgi:hypothetical protein
VLESLKKLRATVLLYLPPEISGAGGMLARTSGVLLLARDSEISMLPDEPWTDERVRAVLGPAEDFAGDEEWSELEIAAASADPGTGHPPREA